MGKAIEEIALKAGHKIISRIDFNDDVLQGIKGADVAIEFTNPEAAKGNILKCFEAKVPVIVGTGKAFTVMEYDVAVKAAHPKELV